MATVTKDTPTRCARCGAPFQPQWNHGRWQRYCSQSCAQEARFRKRDAAQAEVMGDANPRTWLLTELNRGRSITALAHRLDMDRPALHAWMRDLGIRRVVHYE